MVSKAKKAQRRQRQLERQRKLRQGNEQENTSEVKAPEVVAVEPPEGSECGHFQLASLPSIRSALGSSHVLFCKQCNTEAQATTVVRGKGKRKKARNRVLVNTPLSQLWICLQCGNLGCNRELKSHGVRHFESTGHSLALQLQSKAIWCYSCDNYLALLKGVPQHTALHHITAFVTNDLSYRDRVKTKPTKPKMNSTSVQLSPQSTASLVSFIEKVNNAPGEGLRGLVNLGNTCFFNSIMQNLSHLPLLREYLLNIEEGCIPEVEGALTFRLREFMAHMWSVEAGTYNPSSIHSTIVRKAPKFRGFRQQDSHELLQSLLDGVRMEEVDRIRKEQPNFPKNKCPVTFIDELFGGKLVSCVTCHKCRNTSTVTEQFHDLLLPIPPKGGRPKQLLPKQNRKFNSTGVKTNKETKNTSKGGESRAGNEDIGQKTHSENQMEEIEQNSAQEGDDSNGTEENNSGEEQLETDVHEDDPQNSTETSESEQVVGLENSSVKVEQTNQEGDEKKENVIEENNSSSEGNEEYISDVNEGDDPQNSNETSEQIVGSKESSENEIEIQTEVKEHVSQQTNQEGDEKRENVINEENNSGSGVNEESESDIGERDDPENSNETSGHTAGSNKSSATGKKKPLKENQNLKEEERREPADYRQGPIPKNTNPISLLTCLEAFTSPEVLTSSETYNCLTCTRRKYRAVQEKICEATGDYSALLDEEDIPEEKLKSWVSNTATKQFMIKETPPILVLGLKRFGNTRTGLRKIDTKVEFPDEIDLSPFVYSPSNENGKDEGDTQQCFKYYLSGISSHGGGMGGGHYVAYVHHQPRKEGTEDGWYYFSDSHRSTKTLQDVLNTQAYVLFYKRADTC